MRTQTCGEFEIEDVLGHPAEMVEELRDQLAGSHPGMGTARAGDAGDTKIVRDPRRDGFYEVRSEGLTYYIHVLPNTGKVLFLAAWPTAPQK